MIKKLCVLGMLILTSFSFIACENDYIEVETTNEMIELHTWYFTSGLPNNVLVVKHSNESAVFNISVDKGNFRGNPDPVQNVTLKPNGSCNWFANDETPIKLAFIEVIVRLDNHIVGYAVIKIISPNGMLNHEAMLLVSQWFPKMNGKYQKISDKLVKEIIDDVKSYHYDYEDFFKKGL